MDERIMTMVPEQRAWVMERIRNTLDNETFSLGPHTERLEEEFAKLHAGSIIPAVTCANGTDTIRMVIETVNYCHARGDTPWAIDRVFIPLLTIPMIRWAARASHVQMENIIDLDCQNDFLLDIGEGYMGNGPDSLGPGDCVVVVWTAGIITDRVVNLIAELRRRHVFVIEDCSHAFGVDERIGTLGNVASYSFYASKALHAGGEGGIVLFKDNRLREQAHVWRNGGKTGKNGPVIEMSGYSARMSEIEAIITRSFLKFWEPCMEGRRRIMEIYQQHGLTSVQSEYGCPMNGYKYTVRTPRGHAKWLEDYLSCRPDCRFTARTHGPWDFEGRPAPRLTAHLSASHISLPTYRISEATATNTAEAVARYFDMYGWPQQQDSEPIGGKDEKGTA